MSSLERFPQAHSASASKALQAERIVDSQRKLGVAEGLILVHVVEEIVDAAARHRAPPRAEAPPERRLQARRDREEILRRQIAAPVEAAKQVEGPDAGAQRQGHRVAQPEIAPERDAAGDFAEAERNIGYARQAKRRRAAADGKIDSPGQLVAEIVARRQLGPGEHSRRKETIARGRVEEELIAAGPEQAPARPGGALLRIVLELAPRQPRVGDLDHVVRDLQVSDEDGVLDALLDDVVAVREREPPGRSLRLGHLGYGAALAVEHDIDAFVGGPEEKTTARGGQLGEDHVAGSAEVVEVDRVLRAGARLRGPS